MNQQTKNSTRAQATSTLNAEAALKFLPQISKPISNNGPDLKDGDGGGEGSDLTQVVIDVALNGYIITLLFDDESVIQYIANDFDEAIKIIRSHH